MHPLAKYSNQLMQLSADDLQQEILLQTEIITSTILTQRQIQRHLAKLNVAKHMLRRKMSLTS